MLMTLPWIPLAQPPSKKMNAPLEKEDQSADKKHPSDISQVFYFPLEK